MSTSCLGRGGLDVETYYYVTDHLGTPLTIIKESGDVAWEGECMRFAEVYSQSGNVAIICASQGGTMTRTQQCTSDEILCFNVCNSEAGKLVPMLSL